MLNVSIKGTTSLHNQIIFRKFRDFRLTRIIILICIVLYMGISMRIYMYICGIMCVVFLQVYIILYYMHCMSTSYIDVYYP